MDNIKSDKKYLLLDYRTNLKDNKLYNYDSELNLNKEDFKLFKNEWQYLKENKIKIVEVAKDCGWIVIENTKELKDIPYKKIKPDLIPCSKGGYPCDTCWGNCPEFETCNKTDEKQSDNEMKKFAEKYCAINNLDIKNLSAKDIDIICHKWVSKHLGLDIFFKPMEEQN
jgi:hypothetical protein